MSETGRRVLQEIESAFRGVELGDGVSLHETVAIDDYGGSEERLAARAGDEKHDWKKLIDDPEFAHIGRVGGPCFYDAAGFRFHLPAYLSLAVIDFDRPEAEGALESLMFSLTHFSEYNCNRLSILDGPQRRCVRKVLEFLRETHELESEELDRAIEGYWRDQSETTSPDS